MRRVDQLIIQARIVSRNTANADGTYSISDEEVLQYLNDAQDRIQNLICAKKNVAKIFDTDCIISIVANQEEYSLPLRCLLNKQIDGVEFSYDGNVQNYVRLEKLNFFNRDTNITNYPWGYIKRGGSIFLQPTPSVSGGTLRVTFERTLDDLEISRGVISSITTGTATSFAALVLNAVADSYETTTPGWSSMQFCCVVDPYGVRKAYNIPISTYNTGTNTLTPTGGLFTYDTTYDSQIAVGDIAVFNKYSTIFSQLPDDCERYLIHSAAADMFAKDSSEDYDKQSQLVGTIEEDLLRAFTSQTSEVQFVPQMDRADWW
jgi:hypothetical protein